MIRARNQRHDVRGQGGCPCQARVDEPVRHGGPGYVGDQLPAPLHRDMLEDDQVNRQGTQPGADRQGRIRHARRALREVRPAAGTSPRAHRAALSPPARPGSPPAETTGQPPGQRHQPGPGRTSSCLPGNDPRSGPGLPRPSTRPGCPGCFPPLLLLRPLPPRRLPPRPVVHRRRHRGVRAVPRRCPLRRRQLLAEVSDQRLQRGDLLSLRLKTRRLLPDQRITRIHGRPLRCIGHSPRSFLKRRTAMTSTPHPPPKRNRRSPTAAVSRGPECLPASFCASMGSETIPAHKRFHWEAILSQTFGRSSAP